MNIDDETERRILDRAAYIREAVTVLSEKQSLEVETYLEDREQRDIVEREFETAIEACIDIAETLCKHADEPVPDTNAETFERLVRMGVLDADTGETMAEAAKFRNVLSHTYGDTIDDRLVYRHLQNDLHWFLDYLTEIRSGIGDG